MSSTTLASLPESGVPSEASHNTASCGLSSSDNVTTYPGCHGARLSDTIGPPWPRGAVMPRTPLNSLTPSRVCLIKPSALGDVVQALPVLAGLRRLWPKAHIAWVINVGFAPLLEGCPGL